MCWTLLAIGAQDRITPRKKEVVVFLAGAWERNARRGTGIMILALQNTECWEGVFKRRKRKGGGGGEENLIPLNGYLGFRNVFLLEIGLN